MSRVAPKNTGIICMSRRPMYQPISRPPCWSLCLASSPRRDGQPYSTPAGWGRESRPHPAGVRVRDSLLDLGDLVVQRLAVPAEDHVGHRGGRAAGDVLVPERDGREVLEQDLLSLLEDGVRSVDRGRRRAIHEQLVECRVRVVAVVGAGVGGVDRPEEVEEARVVGLPAGSERAGDGALRDVRPQLFEGRVRLALRVDPQRVLDAVGHCVDPRLVTTIGVVADRERSAPRRDGVSLCPQVLGLRRVELQHVAARDLVGPAVDDRRGEVVGRRAGGREDLVGDQLAVDRLRDGRTPANDFTSPVINGWSDKIPGSDVLKFDATKAKDLWKQADAISPWSGSFTIGYNADGGHQAWVDAVANSIKNTLGIDAQGKPYSTFKELRTDITKRTITGAFRTGWQADYPGLYNFLGPIYATNAGSNDGDYSSAEFDTLLAEGISTTDPAVANEKFQAAQEVLLVDLPAIPLWYANVNGGFGESVSNVQFGWNSVPLYYEITK